MHFKVSHHCQSCVKRCDFEIQLNPSNGWQSLRWAASHLPFSSPLAQPTFRQNFNHKIKAATLKKKKILKSYQVLYQVQVGTAFCTSAYLELELRGRNRMISFGIWTLVWNQYSFGNLNMVLHIIIKIIMKKQISAVLQRAYIGVLFSIVLILKGKIMVL